MVNSVLLGSQAPSALIETLERGQSVFEVTAISKTLQCGPSGSVFVGRIEGSACVVKSYQKSKLTDAELCQVHQEVQLHQQLSDSPVSWAVVPFWAAADEGAQLHIVMQHCDQGDLRSMLGSGALSEGCVRDQVVIPLLHALQELHAKGYVHRDLKPDNAFMSSSSALLGDFSLAVGPLPRCSSNAGSLPATPGCAGLYSRCSNDSTTSLTASSSDSLPESDTAVGSSLAADSESELYGSMASLSTSRSSSLLVRSFTAGAAADGRCHAGGTPAYCAPEVVLAAFNSLPLAEALGTHNDIWSLGILVTECLLGTHPYGDAAAASGTVLHSIAGNQPLPISALRVSAQCRDWLAAALTRDPRQRWTAAQLLEHAWISAALPPAGQDSIEQDAATVVLVPGQFVGSRAPAGHADAWDEGWHALSKQQQGFGAVQVQKQQSQQQSQRHAGVSAPPPWVEDDWVTGLDRLSSQLVAAKAAAGSKDAAWTPARCGRQATAGRQQQEQHEVRPQQQQHQQQYAVQGITSWED